MADCAGAVDSPLPNRLQRAGSRCGHPWQHMAVDLSGQVVPCGFWGDSSGGVGLGDANAQGLMEIWNGPAFQELRRRHVEENLEGSPCGSCTAVRIASGHAPSFDWGTFLYSSGHLFLAIIPQSFWSQHQDHRERVELLEDGVPLPLSECTAEEISAGGRGRWTLQAGTIYFSGSDGLPPSESGRRYEVRCCGEQVGIAEFVPDSQSGRNLRVAFREYLEGATVMTAAPSRLGLIESADCNIDCPHCSQNEVRLNDVRQRSETADEAMRLMPKLQEMIWQGGEPFLSRRFRRLLNEFSTEDNPNLMLGFMSNGTLIDERAAEKLKRFPRLNAVVSIDSFDAETFERLRTGADHTRVMANLQRLEAQKDWPSRRVSAQMVVGKTNFPLIAENLKKALDDGITLSMCPIMHYPPTERQNCFEDFDAQTQGWEEALDQAEAVIASRAQDDNLALYNPIGVLRDFRAILEDQRRAHADFVEVVVEIADPGLRLRLMPAPAIVAFHGEAELYGAVAYARLAPGATRAVLRIPRNRFSQPLRWCLTADLFEPQSRFLPSDASLSLEAEQVTRQLTIPPYEPRGKRANVHFIKGRGHKPAGFASQPKDAEEYLYAALRSWPAFLPNYFTPFLTRPDARPEWWAKEAVAADKLSARGLTGPLQREEDGLWSVPLGDTLAGRADRTRLAVRVAGLDLRPFKSSQRAQMAAIGSGYCIVGARVFLALPATLANEQLEIGLSRALPWEHSLAKRHGQLLKPPFWHRPDGWWVRLPAASNSSQILIRDDEYVKTGDPADGWIRIASAGEPAAAIKNSNFYVVEGVRHRLNGPYQPLDGHMWFAPLPQLTSVSEKWGSGPSPVFLFENGRQAAFPHAPSLDVAEQGGGRFVHWEDGLWFSTSDNSDPNVGGHEMEVIIATCRPSAAFDSVTMTEM